MILLNSPEWEARYGVSSVWPAQALPIQFGVVGNNGVYTAVRVVPNTIGYVPYPLLTTSFRSNSYAKMFNKVLLVEVYSLLTDTNHFIK